jgi:hypothetical protein
MRSTPRVPCLVKLRGRLLGSSQISGSDTVASTHEIYSGVTELILGQCSVMFKYSGTHLEIPQLGKLLSAVI